MSTRNLTSPNVIKEILTARHLRLKKRLGQNFLVDRNILNKILEAAGLNSCDLVIEIGAGVGTLTQFIAPRVKKVWAIEIDRGLVEVLRENLAEFPNVEVIHGDALKINFSELFVKEFKHLSPDLIERAKIIGNIPYSITTSLVIKILEEEPGFKKIWLLLPEDVVNRIVALPGEKAYGSFSILVSFYTNVKVLRKINPRAFFPVPGVASMLVKMERRQNNTGQPRNKEIFFALMRSSFKERRKKLSNTLKPYLIKSQTDILEIKKDINIDLNRRGETLSLEEFIKLSDYINERGNYGENQ